MGISDFSQVSDKSLFSFREHSDYILIKEDISSVEFPYPDKISLLFIEPDRGRFCFYYQVSAPGIFRFFDGKSIDIIHELSTKAFP
jgi:hypothetical protein